MGSDGSVRFGSVRFGSGVGTAVRRMEPNRTGVPRGFSRHFFSNSLRSHRSSCGLSPRSDSLSVA